MGNVRRIWGAGIVIVLAAALLPDLAAQTKDGVNIGADVGWLGLYTLRLAEWTENGNRLQSLCGTLTPKSAKWERCRDDALRPIQQSVTLRSAPSREAPAVGALLMTASSEGLRVAYLPENTSTPIDFTPDLPSSNCGYFHHSYRERRGNWFRLSEGPLPRNAWVDWNDLAGEAGYRRIERDDIVESPWGDIVVLGVGASFMRFRAEQERDMWMEVDPPQPPVAPFRERRVPISQLFTMTGKLRVTLRYPCGC